MFRNLLYIIVLSALLLLTGCAGRDTRLEASLGQEFSLSVGQSAVIRGENLEIKFEGVTEDSRCPRNVVCVWAGRVICAIQIIKKDSSYPMMLTQPGLTDQYAEESYDRYQLIFHVEPYPGAGKQIAMGEYRLLLTINSVGTTD